MIGIFDGLTQLINEHGSATVLRERIALAADQYNALEKKVTDLSESVKVAEAKARELESENQRLRLAGPVRRRDRGSPFSPPEV
jgi:hypothetical protein